MKIRLLLSVRLAIETKGYEVLVALNGRREERCVVGALPDIEDLNQIGNTL